MSSNPTIQSPSELRNMSDTELDLVAQAASASGFNPYDILYGPPGNSSSPQPPPGPCTSTLAGFSSGSDMSFETQFSLSPPPARTPSPSPLPTPSPTPRRGRRPMSLLNLAGEQVRAQGINPMAYMARPRRTAGRPGGRGRLVVPDCSSSAPSSLDISFGSSNSSRRSCHGRGRGRASPAGATRRQQAPLPVAGGGGSGGSGAGGSDTSGGSSNTNRT